MSELPLETPETPLMMPLTKKNSYNLLCQFIQTYMQNLETVARKMAELPLDAPDPPHLPFRDAPDYFSNYLL